jgi:hypothetical protein
MPRIDDGRSPPRRARRRRSTWRRRASGAGLIEVRDARVLADNDLPGDDARDPFGRHPRPRRLDGREDRAHERRLSHAVRPDDPDTVLRGQDQIERGIERRLSSDAHLQPAQLEDRLPLARRRRRHQRHLARAPRRRRSFRLERVRALDARLLLRRPRLGAAREPLALAPQDVLPVLLDALLVRHQLGLLLEVVGVAPGVRRQAPALELDDPLRDRVEEVPVVGDEDERAGVRAGEVPLEPLGRGDVEVVRRLVEDRDVGARDEELRERDTPALPAAPRAAGAIDVLHAELVEEAERLVPALPAAEVNDRVVERRLLGDESVVARAAVPPPRGARSPRRAAPWPGARQ